MKALTMPVTKITKSFRRAYRSMHPFEKKVVELTMIARVKAGEPSIEVGYIPVFVCFDVKWDGLLKPTYCIPLYLSIVLVLL